MRISESGFPGKLLCGGSQMLKSSKEFLQQVFRDFSKDECPSMAAALAYATIFSLPSLLLIVIYVAGLVLGPQAASGQIESKLSGAMGPLAAAQIQTMVSNVAQNHAGGLIATALGFAGLILSATSVLLQLQQSLNKAWKVKVIGSGIRHFAMKRLRSSLLLVGAGILAMVSVAASSLISALAKMLPFPGAAHAGELVTSLAMFAIVFAAILKVLPRCKASLERCLGRWRVHRIVVRGREISDRALPGACGEGKRVWGCRVSRNNSAMDLLLSTDLSAGCRIDPGVGAHPGSGSPAEERRCPAGAGFLGVNLFEPLGGI